MITWVYLSEVRSSVLCLASLVLLSAVTEFNATAEFSVAVDAEK